MLNNAELELSVTLSQLRKFLSKFEVTTICLWCDLESQPSALERIVEFCQGVILSIYTDVETAG